MAASSGITLTSGMRANLYSLQNTNSLLERTQKRLATGQRVQSAVDDPVNYFTALGHRQRSQDLASRKDEMSESVQLISAANEGVESITALIASAKSLAQSALSASTTTEINTLYSQYKEVLNQIDQVGEDSGYKGVNLLDSTAITHTVKFDENGDSLLTITGFDAAAQGATLSLSTHGTNAWVSAGGTADKAEINSAISKLDGARSALRTEAQKLSTNLSTITIRQDFTKGMINTLEDGAAELTNADMNEEGANMLMLQTRQSLGTTSLSLASQSAQSVLRLF
ncbi:MAG: flagellin [Desulfobacteraceae bacterium]|nr:MAG: flagellin [Desulfobacteraceae bacterium]